MDKESLKKTSEVLNIIRDTAEKLLAEQNRIHTTLKTALIGLNEDQLKPLKGLQKATEIFMTVQNSPSPVLWTLSLSLMNLDRKIDVLINKIEE